VSDSVRALCANADMLVLESNHDTGMLWRDRIRRRCVRALRRAWGISRIVMRRVWRAMSCIANSAHVVLAHLSENCNDHGMRIGR
jgi:hypothetical protein